MELHGILAGALTVIKILRRFMCVYDLPWNYMESRGCPETRQNFARVHVNFDIVQVKKDVECRASAAEI